jgi:TRAP-type uncharacterized transport system fused permease subunit
MPFLFIYTSILNIGWNVNFFLTVFCCIVALVAWGAALEGYLFRKTTLFDWVCLFSAALGLLDEGLLTDLIGLFLLAMVIVIQKISLFKAKKAALQGDVQSLSSDSNKKDMTIR